MIEAGPKFGSQGKLTLLELQRRSCGALSPFGGNNTAWMERRLRKPLGKRFGRIDCAWSAVTSQSIAMQCMLAISTGNAILLRTSAQSGPSGRVFLGWQRCMGQGSHQRRSRPESSQAKNAERNELYLTKFRCQLRAAKCLAMAKELQATDKGPATSDFLLLATANASAKTNVRTQCPVRD